MNPGLRRWLVACLAGTAVIGAVAAASPLAALQEQTDRLLQSGFDRPDEALAALSTLARSQPPEAQRVLLLTRGLIAANAGRASLAEGAAQRLAASADRLAVADSLLVQAALAHTQGHGSDSLQAAKAALEHYAGQCPTRPDCDWRMQFQALQILARQGGSSGRSHTAREHALAAAELARTGGDAARQAWALANAADLSQLLGDSVAAQRDLARAQRLARLEGSPATLARQRIFETRMFQGRGDTGAARQAAEAGLVQARLAQSPRLEATLLANLSDIHVKSGQPRAALQAVERALPVVRRHADRRIEQVLLHNAALARIALGEHGGARRVLDELLHSHASSGADGDHAVALREFADAFAARGDHAGALALYHRERKLAAEITARNREAALAELRSRFDREAQQRRLQLLGRQSALMTQQLDNRQVMQKLWIAGAAVLLLAMGLVALLYRRVHLINRRLAHNHTVLRAQSRRDPLTGLANRRALHDTAAQLDLQRQFSGALLLVDIDHFKHVNDGHGHANGDLVLVAVAERLARAAGQRDLVVRWGGEEFLIFMPGAGLAQAEALAARVLQVVGGDPVALAAGHLHITASIGYGSFPLPPARLPLSLERAINLADMALYTAKNQGRNRAVGISAARADDAAALARIEDDFDQAWTDGRVTLLRQTGPVAAEGAGQTAVAQAIAA